MKIGLKLWSVNTDAYLREAKRLYAERVFDYLELYVVPGSQATLPLWKALQDELTLPFAIHAPHSAHGVNLADAAKRESNAKAFDEVCLFADQLDAKHIIVHGGTYPHPSDVSPATAIEELVHQLTTLNDSRILLENKPFLPIGDAPIRLVGSTPDEIHRVLAAVGCGFCLDIGHAIASANAHSAGWHAWMDEFLSLRPDMFHLSDMQVGSQKDQHLHFCDGTLPIEEILSRLPKSATISIETKKDSNSDLGDFQRDALLIKSDQCADIASIRLRPAESRDMRAVFELSNDPVVRANSIHKDQIPWEAHVVWFNRAIDDPETVFLVAETDAGDFVGQIRFSRRGGNWVTSISVVPWFRGRGMAKQILENAMLHIPHGRFIAEIAADNERSKRLFASIGFAESKSANAPAGFLTFIKEAYDSATCIYHR